VNKDADYRRKALECAKAAERAHDLHERLELLKMAQAWIKLAEHARSLPKVFVLRRSVRPEASRGADDIEQ